MRRYQGFMADSTRWERLQLRPDDVIITTPSKCGTAWMQKIVGMLLHDRVDLGAPISTISPWLREAVAGTFEPIPGRADPPADAAEYLRWFIDNDQQPVGSGPYGQGD